MNNEKNIVCVIPAKLNSTRFPKKILKNLSGKPLLRWAWDAAHSTGIFKDIVFAIDSEETAKIIESFSGKYIMTSEDCQSGTDRLIEAMNSRKIEGDIWVNWQADEPFVTKEMIETLLQSCHKKDSDVWSLKKRIIKDDEILSPNVTKVVCDANNLALYFSRLQIPYYRDKQDALEVILYKHIGIYAYTTKALQAIAKMDKCYLEEAEKLEQLRFLYYGLTIKLHDTNQETIGIDTLDHLQKAEKYITDNLVNKKQ